MTQSCLATVQELTREWVSPYRMCKYRGFYFFGGEYDFCLVVGSCVLEGRVLEVFRVELEVIAFL